MTTPQRDAPDFDEAVQDLADVFYDIGGPARLERFVEYAQRVVDALDEAGYIIVPKNPCDHNHVVQFISSKPEGECLACGLFFEVVPHLTADECIDCGLHRTTHPNNGCVGRYPLTSIKPPLRQGQA